MIWETKSTVVVMLATEVEDGRVSIMFISTKVSFEDVDEMTNVI